MATTIVLMLIKTAPIAGLNNMPNLYKNIDGISEGIEIIFGRSI